MKLRSITFVTIIIICMLDYRAYPKAHQLNEDRFLNTTRSVDASTPSHRMHYHHSDSSMLTRHINFDSERSSMKKIVVLGAGYVGLVTGACFAKKNNLVMIVELDQRKITALKNGTVPFYEPGLDLLVAEGIQNNNLLFTNNLQEALQIEPDFIFSCVGTPPQADGSADLSAVWQVATDLGKYLQKYAVIVNKSTVPVGTAEKVTNIIQKQFALRQVDIDFDVASNPEFLKEGDALKDFFYPDRVVIGTNTHRAATLLSELYKPFVANCDQIIPMSIESAELTKYAANCMLATRISFMNQMALLADKVGADINDIKRGIGTDKRIGPYFLNAGIGFGGSCFPKDIKALIHLGIENNQAMTLIEEVDAINDQQRQWFIDQITAYYGDSLKNKVVGIWGLAFKPETDDIRSAPSIDIIDALLDRGASIIAYDPVASEPIKKLFTKNITFAHTSSDVLNAADFLIIVTEWQEFRNYAPETFLILPDKTVFDGRNCFDPRVMLQAGINYLSVGRNKYTYRHLNQKKLVRSISHSA